MRGFIHAANILYLLSYWVKDLRTLRLLTLAGILLMIPYFLSQVEPLWDATAWSMVFFGINLFRLQGTSKHGTAVLPSTSDASRSEG